MRYSWFLLMVAFFNQFLSISVYASQSYVHQGTTVLLFYETVLEKEAPSVADFIALFGPNNESELNLILHQKFPDTAESWTSDEEAIKYTEKVYKQPDEFPSLFLRCVQINSKRLFLNTKKLHLVYPPDTLEDFKRFTVLANNHKVIFVFSQNETTIENIILPDGESIYTIIEKCFKIQ